MTLTEALICLELEPQNMAYNCRSHTRIMIDKDRVVRVLTRDGGILKWVYGITKLEDFLDSFWIIESKTD